MNMIMLSAGVERRAEQAVTRTYTKISWSVYMAVHNFICKGGQPGGENCLTFFEIVESVAV